MKSRRNVVKHQSRNENVAFLNIEMSFVFRVIY